MISSGLLALLTASNRAPGSCAGDLLLVDQHERLFELDDLFVLVGDEVRREVAAIELHAFDDLDGGFRLLAFFDRDHAVFADLHEGVGQHVADASDRCCRRWWRPG